MSLSHALWIFEQDRAQKRSLADRNSIRVWSTTKSSKIQLANLKCMWVCQTSDMCTSSGFHFGRYEGKILRHLVILHLKSMQNVFITRTLRDKDAVNNTKTIITEFLPISCYSSWDTNILLILSVLEYPRLFDGGEISPTRCNNCVFYSQWLYSTCFGWQSHPSSGVQCCIWPQVSWFT